MKVNEVKVSYKKGVFGNVSNSLNAADYCRSIPEFENRMEYQEVFVAVYLDNANNILCHQVIGMGAITATMADIRIIFSTALKTLCTSMVLCHNHPSGTLKASKADFDLTNKVKEAGKLFDIQVLDHIILTKNSYMSFADEGNL
jgi:DNA repair protein RadC